MRCLLRWLISNLWQYHVPQKLFAAPHYIGGRLQLLKHLRSWLKSYVPHWAASKKSFATLSKCLHWASTPLHSTSITGKIRSPSSSLVITTVNFDFYLIILTFYLVILTFCLIISTFLAFQFTMFLMFSFHLLFFCFTARNVLPYQSLHTFCQKERRNRGLTGAHTHVVQ